MPRSCVIGWQGSRPASLFSQRDAIGSGFAQGERTHPGRRHRQSPRPGSALGDPALESLFVSEEQLDLLARSEILLGADPHRPDAVLPIGTQFRGAGANASVSGDHDEPPTRDDGHSVQVRRAQRHVNKILMSGIEHIVTASATQQLAQPQRVLVGEVHQTRAAVLRPPSLR